MLHPPPGEPINLIASRRPYDDPGVARVYYRLQPMQETVLAKTHLPYVLNATRMAKIKSWFLDASYQVTALPSYQPELASNPFITFREILVNSRYRFMLEEAQFSFAKFVKGPVCRGQLALNVINDHFWVVFIDPDFEDAAHSAKFMSQGLENLQLPAEHESTARLLAFRAYAELEENYLRSKSEYLNRFGERHPIQLNMLWQGDGSNPNAALTVFRHFDSASVVQGLIGDQPQTVLVFGYPLLERMHYLLVSEVHLTIKAQQRLDEAAGERNTRLLRSAFFAECRNIAEWPVQMELLADLGADLSGVTDGLESGFAHAALAADLAAAETQRVQGSPTFVLNEGRQILYGNVGYRVLEANLRELLRAPMGDYASWC